MFFLEKKKPLLEDDACFVKLQQVILLLTVNNDQEEVQKKKRDRHASEVQQQKWPSLWCHFIRSHTLFRAATVKHTLPTRYHSLKWLYSTLLMKAVNYLPLNGEIYLPALGWIMPNFSGSDNWTKHKKENENSSGALVSTQQTLLNGFYYTTLEYES